MTLADGPDFTRKLNIGLAKREGTVEYTEKRCGGEIRFVVDAHRLEVMLEGMDVCIFGQSCVTGQSLKLFFLPNPIFLSSMFV